MVLLVDSRNLLIVVVAPTSTSAPTFLYFGAPLDALSRDPGSYDGAKMETGERCGRVSMDLTPLERPTADAGSTELVLVMSNEPDDDYC